jgi:hypothetical protein
LVDVGAERSAVVEHRVGQHLGDRVHLSPFAGQERQPGGETAARARAADRHPVGVHVIAGGQPRERVVAVVQRGREGVLGCQPVLDRGDDRVDRAGETPAPGVVLRRGTHDEAATVDPQDRRMRAAVRAGGPV